MCAGDWANASTISIRPSGPTRVPGIVPVTTKHPRRGGFVTLRPTARPRRRRQRREPLGRGHPPGRLVDNAEAFGPDVVEHVSERAPLGSARGLREESHRAPPRKRPRRTKRCRARRAGTNARGRQRRPRVERNRRHRPGRKRSPPRRLGHERRTAAGTTAPMPSGPHSRSTSACSGTSPSSPPAITRREATAPSLATHDASSPSSGRPGPGRAMATWPGSLSAAPFVGARRSTRAGPGLAWFWSRG